MTRNTGSRARRALRELVALYWDSGVSDDVPALAWFLISSLVPLALGITALLTVLLGDYAHAQALAERITRVLPKDVQDQVTQLILRTKRDSPLLIVGSIAGMVWTSSGAVGVLARVLSRLLARPGAGLVTGKLRNLGVALGLATLVVLIVVVASAGTGVVHRIGLDPLVTRIAVPLLSLAVTVSICASIYWVLAAGAVSWHSALAGGLVGGLVLLVTPTVAGYYLRLVAGGTPVALFLMLAGVLFTCYLAALGLLLGAGAAARVTLGRRLGTEAATDKVPSGGAV
jgi:uncharacterized BrkB/YihY/UPF0761 family membrane protein